MIESILLVLSICIDSFVCSIAYGCNKIKVPIYSSMLISIICTLILGISLFLGNIFKVFIPINYCRFFSFFILLILGLYRLFEGVFKSILRKKYIDDKPIKLKLFDFILLIYVDETMADIDNSKILSLKESIYLAIALSLDSLAVGIGASLAMKNYILTIILSLIINLLTIIIGVFIGRSITRKINLNLSWISGAILIILAFFKV